MSKTSYHFTTYDYVNLDTNDDDKNNLTKDINYGDRIGEWVFIY